MKNMPRHLLLLVIAVALVGCVNVAQMSQEVLSAPTAIKEQRSYMVSDAGRVVSKSSEYDWIGYAAGAVAAGAVTGSAQAGMSLTAATDTSARTKASPFAAAASVDIAKLFESQAAGSAFGSLVPLDPNVPNRVVVTPRVNLRTQEGVDVSYQCTLNVEQYAEGKRVWSRVYKNPGAKFVKGAVAKPPTAEEFKSEAGACLASLTRAFARHVSGDLSRAYTDGLFRPGVVMYTANRGQKNAYYKDGRDGMIYAIWTDGIEIVPAAEVHAYTPQ